MKKTEVLAKIQEIGTCTDDVQRRNLLADLQAETEKDYDERDSLLTEKTTLTNENENLRKANLKLFLRLGKENEEVKENNNTKEENNGNVKRTFESLFNEKGELK